MTLSPSLRASLASSLQPSLNPFQGGDNGPVSIQSVIPSACFDLDITQPTGFDGDQTLNNLVLVPNDSVAQSAYNYTLGATVGSSTDDPTPVNEGTASGYLDLDGGDICSQIDTTNGTIIQKAQRSDLGHGLWFGTMYQSGSSTANYGIMGAGATGSLKGWRLSKISGDLWVIIHSVTNTVLDTNIPLPTNEEISIFVTWDSDLGSNNIKVWVKTSTGSLQTVSLNTNTADYTGQALLCDTEGITPMPSGFRWYAACGGNSFIDDSDVSAALDFYSTVDRHNRTYT